MIAIHTSDIENKRLKTEDEMCLKLLEGFRPSGLFTSANQVVFDSLKKEIQDIINDKWQLVTNYLGQMKEEGKQ